MIILDKTIEAKGIRLSVENEDKKEIARATLYILFNDLHKKPFGLLEDLFVIEEERGKGIASELIKKIIEKAKENSCYKIIATSRYERNHVHEMYKKHGFKDYGKEFRIDL